MIQQLICDTHCWPETGQQSANTAAQIQQPKTWRCDKDTFPAQLFGLVGFSSYTCLLLFILFFFHLNLPVVASGDEDFVVLLSPSHLCKRAFLWWEIHSLLHSDSTSCWLLKFVQHGL